MPWSCNTHPLWDPNTEYFTRKQPCGKVALENAPQSGVSRTLFRLIIAPKADFGSRTGGGPEMA